MRIVIYYRQPKEGTMPRKKPRNYKKEYKEYHGTKEQKENRNKRNKARRKLKLKKGDPREVDHKKPLSKGGSNGRKNLRAVSKKVNRKKSNK